MIVDCFMFFNELDILEIRLNELSSIVDQFVLVESTVTFQHESKPLFFREHKDRFQSFLDRIVALAIDKPALHAGWDTEANQRCSLKDGLTDCRPSDIIMISDVDEIPRASAVQDYFDSGKRCQMFFEMAQFYHYLNCAHRLPIHASMIMPYGWCRAGTDFNDMRKRWQQADRDEVIPDAGWHFSYQGGIDNYIYKLKSYSHGRYAGPEFTNREAIIKAFQEPRFMLFGGDTLKFVDFDDTFPRYLLDNLNKFQHLIYHAHNRAVT